MQTNAVELESMDVISRLKIESAGSQEFLGNLYFNDTCVGNQEVPSVRFQNLLNWFFLIRRPRILCYVEVLRSAWTPSQNLLGKKRSVQKHQDDTFCTEN